MTYIERLERPRTLELDSKLVFKLSNGDKHCGVIKKSSGYYVDFPDINSVVFDILGIDRNTFVEDIVGYKPCGLWPETKNLEDLEKVLNALLQVNKSKPEEVKKVEDEWSWLLD